MPWRCGLWRARCTRWEGTRSVCVRSPSTPGQYSPRRARWMFITAMRSCASSIAWLGPRPNVLKFGWEPKVNDPRRTSRSLNLRVPEQFTRRSQCRRLRKIRLKLRRIRSHRPPRPENPAFRVPSWTSRRPLPASQCRRCRPRRRNQPSEHEPPLIDEVMQQAVEIVRTPRGGRSRPLLAELCDLDLSHLRSAQVRRTCSGTVTVQSQYAPLCDVLVCTAPMFGEPSSYGDWGYVMTRRDVYPAARKALRSIDLQSRILQPCCCVKVFTRSDKGVKGYEEADHEESCRGSLVGGDGIDAGGVAGRSAGAGPGRRRTGGAGSRSDTWADRPDSTGGRRNFQQLTPRLGLEPTTRGCAAAHWRCLGSSGSGALARVAARLRVAAFRAVSPPWRQLLPAEVATCSTSCIC